MRVRNLLLPAAIIGIGALTVANAAGAHNHLVVASCQGGLTVSLASYVAAETNTVVVRLDGVTLVATTFGTGFSGAWANPDKTVPHSYSIAVTTTSGVGAFTTAGTIPACTTAPTTTGATTSTAPATTTRAPTTGSPATSTTTPSPPSTPTSTVSPTTTKAKPPTIKLPATR